jgi:hypothetical protein
MLQFPFWIVTLRSPLTSDQPGAYTDSPVPWTFSTAGRMTDFMTGQTCFRSGQFEIRLVNRYVAGEIIHQLIAVGCTNVCHDANPDGSGGTAITLNSIAAMLSE